MTTTAAHTSPALSKPFPRPVASARPGRITLHPTREQSTAEQRSVLADRFPAFRGRTECPRCGKLFSAGSIAVMDEWKHTESGGGSIVRLGHYCDHCYVLRQVVAHLSSAGELVEVMKRSDTADQRTIDAFLKLYPEARGIVE